MIATVTTTTVSTVTTIALTGSLALVGVIALLALLVQKEVGASAAGHPIWKMSRALNIAIVPLLITFVLIVISKIAGALH